MSGWIDVSMPLGADLPTWPGSPGVSTRLREAIGRGDNANVTQVEMDVHSGTHVDAPLHFVAGGATIGDVGLDPFVGSAVVVDVGDATRISAQTLEGLGVPAGTTRLLLRSDNTRDRGRRTAPFDEGYAALTLCGAEWVAARGLKLIGIDYLSIQRFEDGPETHQVILGAGVCILEGLDLTHAPPGRYELICLPLAFTDAEAAPARAILRPSPTDRAE